MAVARLRSVAASKGIGAPKVTRASNGPPASNAARYGDMDLAPHLAALLSGGPFEARVTFEAPIPFDAATDRKCATAKAEAAVRRAFHAAVIPGRPEGPNPKALDKRDGALAVGAQP